MNVNAMAWVRAVFVMSLLWGISIAAVMSARADDNLKQRAEKHAAAIQREASQLLPQMEAKGFQNYSMLMRLAVCEMHEVLDEDSRSEESLSETVRMWREVADEASSATTDRVIAEEFREMLQVMDEGCHPNLS